MCQPWSLKHLVNLHHVPFLRPMNDDEEDKLQEQYPNLTTKVATQKRDIIFTSHSSPVLDMPESRGSR